MTCGLKNFMVIAFRDLKLKETVTCTGKDKSKGTGSSTSTDKELKEDRTGGRKRTTKQEPTDSKAWSQN